MKYKALKAAFPHTIPILAGYWFLGITYGIYATASGFSFLYPLAMSTLVYGGSLEFVCVSMLLSPFAPLASFIMALLIQARHLFYGISMLEKFDNTGWKKFFLIFWMSDETFSVAYSADIPKDVDKGWFYFFISMLDYIYWSSGALMGSLVGNILPINTEGISFVMTAMFVVIFLDQFLKEKDHTSSYMGLAASIICLMIFGADSFMIPTMISIIILLAAFRKKLDKSDFQESSIDADLETTCSNSNLTTKVTESERIGKEAQ